jgi:predicted phosphate transport protein (TIGR00153 family)
VFSGPSRFGRRAQDWIISGVAFTPTLAQYAELDIGAPPPERARGPRPIHDNNTNMLNKLMPREGRFFDLFNAHAAQIVVGSNALSQLIVNAAASEEYARRIDTAERDADKITHEAISLLHRTFITPIDRDQIHQLITRMDDILDLIQDVAESVVLYDIRRVTPEAEQLTHICHMSCDRVRAVVGMLSNLRAPEAIMKTCQEIDRLESDADRVMRSAISRLFREEADVKELIKLRSIYEQLELITDRCEDVANIVEGIVLEHS